MADRDRARRLTTPWLLGGLVAVASACSIVSGWDDLQSEPPESGKSSSSGSSDDDDEPDGKGSSGTSGSNGDTPKITCGATTCEDDEGCCTFGNNPVCTKPGGCSTGSFFLKCSLQSDCAGHPAGTICCFDFANLSATCVSDCSGVTEGPICEESNPECPPGEACTASAGVAWCR